jgi:hypothetical protein
MLGLSMNSNMPASIPKNGCKNVKVTRIRLCFQKEGREGLRVVEASAYSNTSDLLPNRGGGKLNPDPTTTDDRNTVQSASGERTHSIGTALSSKAPPSTLSEDTRHHAKTDDEQPVDDSDQANSQALPTQHPVAFSEYGSSSGAKVDDAPAAENSTAPGLARRPNGKWAPGTSGNPAGRKPNPPPNPLDQPSAVEEELEKKVKVKRGDKTQTVTKGDAILEQWINKAAKGDLGFLRLLISHSDKHGLDLFASRHKAIQKAAAETMGSSSLMVVTEEVLARLSPTTLEELKKVVKEVEAEEKKKMH